MTLIGENQLLQLVVVGIYLFCFFAGLAFGSRR